MRGPLLLALAFAAALPGAAAAASLSARWVNAGIAVDLTVESLEILPVGVTEPPPLRAGDSVRFRLSFSDTTTGTPLSGLAPGAWIDGRQGGPVSDEACTAKVSSFVGGDRLAAPVLSLNGYVAAVMNEDASLGVLDPVGGFGGTRLLAMVPLASPAQDWALTADQTRIYAALPAVGEVAVVDTATWKVTASIKTGSSPARLALEPGERRLWVLSETTGVVAMALPDGKVAPVTTGTGPHRIAFSEDGRKAYVSNPGDGTVSVIETETLKELKRLAVGRGPSALAYSPPGKSVYVANAEAGTLTVIDAERDTVATTLTAEPGLGEIRFAPGGRFGFLLNPLQDLLHIVDAASRRIVQTGKVEREPDQVVFSATLAYVRHRGSEIVLLIPLEKIGVEGQPLPIGDFPGGRAAFGAGHGPSAADGFARVPGMSAMLVANPADRSVYFYKEGMAAPMGDLANRPREPRAVLAVDRSLRETRPGVYETTTVLPRAGTYDLALFLSAPRMIHCFPLTVAPEAGAPAREAARRVTVEPLLDGLPGGKLTAGAPARLRARLTDSSTGKPVDGAADLSVLILATGSNWSLHHEAAPRGEGLYEAEVRVPSPGIYYVYFVAPSLGLTAQTSPRLVLAAAPQP